ncbi:hypothetical protein NA8A_10848 [Nitratireductor indicus C115]|uniref:Uncharacterized protein n=1 Tax=Nitratireductor indicus C115 TaxID=1231190 RepID=K2NTC9_9HYPH|nr:hypothetical protein [Nitratireductor indicus]EKF42555.1 hypothetical protein NA8A_10848 [Nitratireductor indicus C115]SFQ57291.1 hypothetical protein SAMN05216176_106202 [Nitratireductor indicus]
MLDLNFMLTAAATFIGFVNAMPPRQIARTLRAAYVRAPFKRTQSQKRTPQQALHEKVAGEECENGERPAFLISDKRPE